MRKVVALFVLGFASVSLSAQAPKAAPKDPPGYKSHKIDGVTFLVAQAVFDQDDKAFEKKPLDVLAAECKAMLAILPPKGADLFKKLPIWVEWNNEVRFKNGRPGFAMATYYGGPPQAQLAEGRHPLQSKTITIHRLKAFTESGQKRAPDGDLLLHEFAHAVHDQTVGFDFPAIKSAYQQAMERKLYDKDLYAATNANEYFAEISVAYLSRLNYYPKSRDDLQKHDAAGFKVAEVVWGKAASKAAAEATASFNMAVVLPKDVRFGDHVYGPEITTDKLAGKVVVVGYWGRDNPGVLAKLDKWHDELAPYGLAVVAPYAAVRDPMELRDAAAKRGADDVSVLTNGRVQDTPGTFSSPKSGHAIVFAHDGKCAHRGEVHDAERAVRAAVGKVILSGVKMPDTLPKPLEGVVESIASGTPLLSVMPKLSPLTITGDEDAKAAAKALQDAILAPGTKALADAQGIAKTDPVGAYLAAEKVAAAFKNTALATKATGLTNSLKSNVSVAAELKARAVLLKIQAIAAQLDAQPGSFDPTSTAFQTKNRPVIQQGQTLLEQMKKQFPQARSTKEAEKLMKGFGG